MTETYHVLGENSSPLFRFYGIPLT